jgi:pSer/pThr/pTyr-binding forkhead associated (FHA) protein
MTPNISNEELPPIYVSKPSYDDMGAILDRLGIEYLPAEDVNLSAESDSIVMLNCSFSWDDEINKNSVEGFIERGGTLMASDLTAPAISSFTEASFAGGGWGDSVQAQIVDRELADLLGQEHLELDFDTAIKEPTTLPRDATPLIRASDRDSVIAYKFNYGRGSAVYTSFHNHSQPSEVEDALLQVLLMVPIAESTNTTVTETYTSIVEEDDGEDTTLIDPDTGDTTEVYGKTSSGRTDTRVSGHDEGMEIRLVVEDSRRESISINLSPGESRRIGRSDFKGIVDSDDSSYVSGEHLEVKYSGNQGGNPVVISDTDSTNGTSLDGRDISDGGEYGVDSGSTVTLAKGRVSFTVEYG